MPSSSIYSDSLVKRIFASGAIGNILETYDLILISLMATTLGKTFFPPVTLPYANITNILYVFLIGLLVRPIGNIIMGILADQHGRKKIMIVSLLFTGLGTIAIGFLPSYKYIGVWSTVLFVLLRIFLNFFSGIEYINSATYLIESTKKENLGYYASWTAIGINGGYLLASIVGLIISTLIENKILTDWCWRLVFLFSIFGVFFGYWIRKSIPESLTFIMAKKNSKNTAASILKASISYIFQHPIQCFSISLITLLGIFLSYIYYIYIPIELINTRHFSKIQVYSLNCLSLIIVVLLIPFFGKISDYINRITLLKFICVIVSALAFPFFWLCSYGSYIDIVLISALISIPSSCFFSVYPTLITQSFPVDIRCTTASLIYQIIVSIEMGTLPLVIIYTIKITNVIYSPAFLLILVSTLALIGLITIKK